MDLWNRITSKMSGGAGNRVAILGLDGAPYTLLDRFIRDGLMPNLAQIVREGRFVQMDTSIPEISSVAWTTFFTGVNPARHGIYGFMDLRPGGYEMVFPNSGDIRSRPVWDVLAEHGKRSVVLNVPSTYPAKPMNGVLVSGFVALELAKAVYPASLLPVLERAGYRLDVDAMIARESLDRFADALLRALEAREKILWKLLVEERWDLYVGVITETDRMHHYLWAAIEDPNHRFHDFFKSVYRRVDAFLGKVYDWFRGKGLFMIMSDHGFCGIRREVYLNNWLAQEGYLAFGGPDPRSLEDIDPKSRAFNMDPARIYLHVRGRYPNGCVAPGAEYEALREEIAKKLMQFRIEGRPVVRQVFTREELYRGPLIHLAPDLLVLPHWGFDLKGTLSRRELYGNSPLTGMHTRDDSTFFINVRDLPDRRVNILDLAPTAVKGVGIDPGGAFDTPPLI